MFQSRPNRWGRHCSHLKCYIKTESNLLDTLTAKIFVFTRIRPFVNKYNGVASFSLGLFGFINHSATAVWKQIFH